MCVTNVSDYICIIASSSKHDINVIERFLYFLLKHIMGNISDICKIFVEEKI